MFRLASQREDHHVPPFDDPREFIRMPRLSTLALSPDGSWLAVAVSTLDAAGTKFTSSIWRVAADPAGAAASRLTHSSAGESGPAFLPDGSLLFLSKRPAPAQPAGPAAKNGQDDGATEDGSKNDGKDSQDGGDKPAIWKLPALGGEATRVAVAPGGISGLATARSAPALLATTSVHPKVTGLDADAKRRQARKDAGVTAILHEPVRSGTGTTTSARRASSSGRRPQRAADRGRRHSAEAGIAT
jgi:hypothetical protein